MKIFIVKTTIMTTIKSFLEKEKLKRFFCCLLVSVVLCYLIGIVFGVLTTIVICIAKEIQLFFDGEAMDKNNYIADLFGTIGGSVILLIFYLFL